MPLRRLRHYQIKGFSYCKSVQHPALFWDMRLGKNIITIRACKYWNCQRNIIITPLETFNPWVEELIKENIDRSDIQILEGTRKQRLTKLENMRKWNLLNTEGWSVIPEIKDVPWDAMIFDETYALSNPKTKIWKFFTKNFRKIPHRFGLSGLPAPENVFNYIAQMQFIDPNCFKIDKPWHIWNFRARNFSCKFHKWEPTQKGKKFIIERLAKFTSIVEKKDIPGLHGELLYKKIYIKQTPLFRNIQNTLNDEYVLELNKKEIKSTINAPTSFIWLHQLCGGFVDKKFLISNKLSKLRKFILENLKSKQFVLCASHKEEIDLLYVELTKLKISVEIINGDIKPKERRIQERRFKKGYFQCFLLNPDCYKYGANISIADIMIFYSSPSSLNIRRQVEQRIVDVTQVNSATIYEFIYKDSVDEDISDSVHNKETNQALWKRIIKRIQKRRKDV